MSDKTYTAIQNGVFSVFVAGIAVTVVGLGVQALFF